MAWVEKPSTSHVEYIKKSGLHQVVFTPLGCFSHRTVHHCHCSVTMRSCLQVIEQGVYVDLQNSTLLDEEPARTVHGASCHRKFMVNVRVTMPRRELISGE